MYTTHQPDSSMGTAPGRENGAPRLDEDGTAISFDRADERALENDGRSHCHVHVSTFVMAAACCSC